jgi:hypothetical protein
VRMTKIHLSFFTSTLMMDTDSLRNVCFSLSIDALIVRRDSVKSFIIYVPLLLVFCLVRPALQPFNVTGW